MLIAWLAVIIFPKEILSVFTTDKDMIVSGEHALKLYFFGFFFMSFQFVGQSTFTALGCAKRAVFFFLCLDLELKEYLLLSRYLMQ